MFSLNTFGGLKLLDGDGREVAFPEKGLLILAYLLLEPTTRVSRGTVARLLWGDDNGGAQANLRKLISRIRSRQLALGRSFLRFSDTVVELETPPSASDLWFAHPEQRGSIFVRLKLLKKTLEADFLLGVDCQSSVFFHWRETQRRRHAELLKEMLNEAFGQARAKDDIALVRDVALLALGIDPEDRDINRILLRIFDGAGDVEHFRRVFELRLARLDSWSRRRGDIAAVPRDNAIPHSERASNGRRRVSIPPLVLPSMEMQGTGYDVSTLVNDITVGFSALESLDVPHRCTAVWISRTRDGAAATFDQRDGSYILDMRLGLREDEPQLFSQLVDAASDEVIWAERVSLAWSLPQQRQAVARHIVLSLAGQIERREMVRSHFKENPASYQRYLAAKRYLARLSVPNLLKARTELEAVFKSSGHFGPTLSSIARTYSKQWVLTSGADATLLNRAESYAMQAIAIQRDIADGYRELGMTKTLQGANDESIEALTLAETLDPSHAGIIADHAEALLHSSRPDLALTKIESAIGLNPVSPDTYLWTASVASYTLGRFETALDYIERMADPRLADRISAASWAMLGQEERASFFVRRMRKTNPGFDVDHWVSVVPFKEQWQRDIYRDGLRRAGFWKAETRSIGI